MTLRPCRLVIGAVLLVFLPRPAWSSIPLVTNSSETIEGDLISIESWHAQTLTNISWNISTLSQKASHAIFIFLDVGATEAWRFSEETESNEAQAYSYYSTTYVPRVVPDEPISDACSWRGGAFDLIPKNAFNTDELRALVTVDLADDTAWWYTASLSQEPQTTTGLTSGMGSASVLLSEPGLYTVCLLQDNDTCVEEECISPITVYQPPYDFLEVEGTNVGNVVVVRFNLITRYAFSSDWGLVRGVSEVTTALDETTATSGDPTSATYEDRCWFYFGRAVEFGGSFFCSPDPDSLLASFQSTPTLRAYQYGNIEFYISSAGFQTLSFVKVNAYPMITNFYICGITVQPLDSITVTTTSDVVVTAVPEHGETCGVGNGIELEIRTGEVAPQIEGVDAWIYFTGRVVNISFYETSLSIRLPYQGKHDIFVSLSGGATLDVLNVTAVAADPYAPSCQVTVPPMGISPLGSPITVSFQAKDFYSNTISAEWGNESFDAWSFNSIDNISAAHVYDKNNGSFQVLSNPLDNTDTTFLFVERNGLGIPGSPFEVYVFGPSTCKMISSAGECRGQLSRPIYKTWATNSPCKAHFEDPEIVHIRCDYVPVGSTLGRSMVAFSTFSALYAALYLVWIRRHRQTVIVKLSQPFVCQLFLVGCILLNMTTMVHLGAPSDVVCVARPWILHVALTFTSSCLYMKTYRVHKIFNNSSRLARISISDRQLVIWVLRLVGVDVLLLLVWTVMDRPRRVDRIGMFNDIEASKSTCTGGFDLPVFSIILWTWKACLNFFGMVIATKTWNCEDGVGESQPICLSVYNTTVLGLVNLGIQLLLSDDTASKNGASTFTAAAGTVFTVTVLFGPKVYRLWWYGDLASNPLERRGSSTKGLYSRNSSLTDVSGARCLTRRKSSISMDFLKIARIQPITEDPSEEEAAEKPSQAQSPKLHSSSVIDNMPRARQSSSF